MGRRWHRLLMVILRLSASLSMSVMSALADEQSSLQDKNGDGQLSILAFGDSITSGLGDGFPPGAFVEDVSGSFGIGGYPTRLAALLGVATSNAGMPGEELLSGGVARVAQLLSDSQADVVCVLEGSNDAIHQADTTDFRRAIQRVLNIAGYRGKAVLLLTIPPSCCNHAGAGPFTSGYSASIRELATLNSAPLADIERAWRSSCQNPDECELYNLPEGLHPNSKGYDVIAQTVAAALLGIDVFLPDGAALLAQALGVDPATIVVRPDSV